MRELREILGMFARHRGEPMALATLVRSQGSSYRRPGARMLMARDTHLAGALSGGCLEDEIVQRAAQVVKSGVPTLMSFDTRARFGCHGAIDVFVERLPEIFLESIAESVRERRSCLAVTEYLGTDRTGSRALAEFEPVPETAFVQRIPPLMRLVLLGHGPDTDALSAFGRLLGWQVDVVENAADFADVLDERTAVVIGTHHYGRDFAALRALTEHPLPYIGLIGSRRRRDRLLGDLLDAGAVDCENIFGPAGLDLGAESPEQIALSIVAEIQSVFGEGTGHSLRTHRGPIHATSEAPDAARNFAARA